MPQAGCTSSPPSSRSSSIRGWRSVLAMLTASAPAGDRASLANASSPRSAPRGSSRTPFCRNKPDSFLPEYGPRQYEVTIAPQPALKAADQAVIARELTRATAFRLGHRAIFSPMPVADGTGNGVHIHFSLHDASSAPVTYDPNGPLGLSEAAAQFCAGMLRHLPAIAAITAPSPVSYLRLTPNRWSPTVIDIVRQDRGAALRVCPVFAATTQRKIAKAFHLEFRVSDGSASPYMALGAMIFAGADGIGRKLALPKYVGEAPPLPRSLGEALDGMEKSAAVQEWFGPTFLEAYLRHKRSELAHVAALDPPNLCARYAEVYSPPADDLCWGLRASTRARETRAWTSLAQDRKCRSACRR